MGRDYELEINLVEAKRLIVHMRSLSRDMSSESSPTVCRPVPETIEMIDNQTECSSLGIGHIIENAKLPSPSDSGKENDTRRDTVTPVSFDENDSSRKELPEEKLKFSSRQAARAAKRNIEDILKRSKLSLGSNRVVQYTIDEDVELNHEPIFDIGKTDSAKFQKSNTSCVDDVMTYPESDSFIRDEKKYDESVVRSPRSPIGLKKLKCISMLNTNSPSYLKSCSIVSPVNSSKSSSSTQHQDDSDDVLRAAEEVERAILALGESSRSLQQNLRARSFSGNLVRREIDLFNTTDSLFGSNISPETPNGIDSLLGNKPSQAISNASHEKVQAAPLVKSNWLKSSLVHPDDDDCTSVADYCKFKEKNVEAKSYSSPRKKEHNSIKWEKMSNASSGDSDYVPIQDYSIPSPKKNVTVDLFEEKASKLSNYRVMMRRKRKARRRRIAIAAMGVIVVMLMAVVYRRTKSFGWMLSELIRDINRAVFSVRNGSDIMSDKSSPEMIDFLLANNSTLMEVNKQPQTIDFNKQPPTFYFPDQQFCPQACSFYFNMHNESDEVIVPTECFGINVEDWENQQLVLDNAASIERFICKAPLITNMFPACRQSISLKDQGIISRNEGTIGEALSVGQVAFCNFPFVKILPLCRQRIRQHQVQTFYSPSQYYTNFKS